MTSGNKAQEKSLLKQLLGTETLICCVGIGSIVYGLVQGVKIMQVFFGICIIAGSFALRFVRKKDWQAHWAEMEQLRQAQEARMAQEREKSKE